MSGEAVCVGDWESDAAVRFSIEQILVVLGVCGR